MKDRKQQAKSSYDIFQKTLKGKYHKGRGEMIFLATLSLGSALGEVSQFYGGKWFKRNCMS